MIEEWLEEMLTDKMLRNRETCEHWVDYEIYDALPDHLKERYVSKLKFPSIYVTCNSSKNDCKVLIECKVDPLKNGGKLRCDCAANYPKTAEYLLNPFRME